MANIPTLEVWVHRNVQQFGHGTGGIGAGSAVGLEQLMVTQIAHVSSGGVDAPRTKGRIEPISI
jgi:hypothetical protein